MMRFTVSILNQMELLRPHECEFKVEQYRS